MRNQKPDCVRILIACAVVIDFASLINFTFISNIFQFPYSKKDKTDHTDFEGENVY